MKAFAITLSLVAALLPVQASARAADERAPLAKRLGGFRQTNTDFTNGTTGFGLHAAVSAFPAARFEHVLETLDGVSERATRGKAVVALCAQHLRPTG